jgi:hypothetical protein
MELPRASCVEPHTLPALSHMGNCYHDNNLLTTRESRINDHFRQSPAKPVLPWCKCTTDPHNSPPATPPDVLVRALRVLRPTPTPPRVAPRRKMVRPARVAPSMGWTAHAAHAPTPAPTAGPATVGHVARRGPLRPRQHRWRAGVLILHLVKHGWLVTRGTWRMVCWGHMWGHLHVHWKLHLHLHLHRRHLGLLLEEVVVDSRGISSGSIPAAPLITAPSRGARGAWTGEKQPFPLLHSSADLRVGRVPVRRVEFEDQDSVAFTRLHEGGTVDQDPHLEKFFKLQIIELVMLYLQLCTLHLNLDAHKHKH